MLDRLVNIFKKSTPTVQRFAERKFALILEEQENDLHQREAEVKDLTLKNTLLQLEVTQLRSFMNSCTETMDALCNEVQRDFLSLYFLREEKKHLENMKAQMAGVDGFNKVVEFYDNMRNLLQFLEAFAGIKIRDTQNNNNAFLNSASVQELENLQNATDTKSMHDKMQSLVNAIVDLSDEMSGKATVPTLYVRSELDKIMKRVQEIVGDVFKIKDVFKSSLRQKRKLESEVLSMLHSFQEMRRLEREVKEKQSHIAELNKQGQMMKKKTKHHRKHLEQIQLNVEQKKIQSREIQSILERHISSADQRLHSLLNLLPDLNENHTVNRSDTDLTFGDSSDTSRLGTPAITERMATMTPLNKQRVSSLNLEMETLPSNQTPRSTKVTFSSTCANADQGVTLTKLQPQGKVSKAVTPRLKQGLLKQRSNVNTPSLRKGLKTPNDGAKLKSIDPASARTINKSPSSNVNLATKSDTAQNVADKKKSAQDDIDKWVSEQNKSGRTQAIQRKLALYQAQSDKTKEKELEKEETIRNTLAKSDQQMLNLETRKPPPVQQKSESPTAVTPQPLTQPFQTTSDRNVPIPTDINWNTIPPNHQTTIQELGSSRPNSASRSGSHNSSSSASVRSKRSCNSTEDNPVVVKKIVELDTTMEVPPARRPRPSRHGTLIDSDRGMASVATINAESVNLPSASQTQLRQSYSQMFNSHADMSHVKKQENRQPLPTKQIMIRLPSQ